MLGSALEGFVCVCVKEPTGVIVPVYIVSNNSSEDSHTRW